MTTGTPYTGRNVVDQEGHTEWQEGPRGKHAYLVPRMPAAALVAVLDDLLVQPPARRR